MTTTEAPRRPPGRYDEPTPLSRPVLIGGSVVLVIALAAVALIGFSYYSSSRTPFTNLGYKVISDTSVDVTFQVDKSRGDTVECQLQARDRYNSEVGSLLVKIGPSQGTTVTRTSTVTTKARATAGEVLSCRPSA